MTLQSFTPGYVAMTIQETWLGTMTGSLGFIFVSIESELTMK